MKKEKNKWKTIFWIMLVINILLIIKLIEVINNTGSCVGKTKTEICASENITNCGVCVNGEMSCNYIDSAGYADPEKYLTCPCGGSDEE